MIIEVQSGVNSLRRLRGPRFEKLTRALLLVGVGQFHVSLKFSSFSGDLSLAFVGWPDPSVLVGVVTSNSLTPCVPPRTANCRELWLPEVGQRFRLFFEF